MERPTIPRALLAVVYAFHVLLGVYAFATRGLNIIQGVLIVMSVITLLAILNYAGNWARITGLVYAALFGIVGAGGTWLGLRSLLQGTTQQVGTAVIGLALLALGIWTFLSLRRGRKKSEQAA